MLPISEQYLQSPCELKSMENVLILSGHISKIKEDSIEIASEESMPIIHCDTTVKISIFNSAQGFKVLVGRIYLSTPEFARIISIQTVTDYEKRNFFRVRISLPCNAHLVYEDETGGVPLHPFDIQVRDLSLSGLYMTCQMELKPEDRILVNMDIHHVGISLLCKVIRVGKTDVYPYENGFGCEFLDNSGRQYDLLCKYLFECQREQIQHLKHQGP